jgi:hypothetical protein
MFKVTEVRWATKSDLATGELWKKWGLDNRLPRWFWQRVWEYPWVFSKIDSPNSLLDVGGTYPFVLFKHFPSAKSVDARDLNIDPHPLHFGKWPEGTLIISDAREIPLENKSFDTVMSISALEEMPEPERVLGEMMRIASTKVIVTCDVGGYGIPPEDFKRLFSEWKIDIPRDKNLLTSLSYQLLRYRQRPVWKNRKIRVVGIVFERI